jgi:hypothetical protein
VSCCREAVAKVRARRAGASVNGGGNPGAAHRAAATARYWRRFFRARSSS